MGRWGSGREGVWLNGGVARSACICCTHDATTWPDPGTNFMLCHEHVGTEREEGGMEEASDSSEEA